MPQNICLTNTDCSADNKICFKQICHLTFEIVAHLSAIDWTNRLNSTKKMQYLWWSFYVVELIVFCYCWSIRLHTAIDINWELFRHSKNSFVTHSDNTLHSAMKVLITRATLGTKNSSESLASRTFYRIKFARNIRWNL